MSTRWMNFPRASSKSTGAPVAMCRASTIPLSVWPTLSAMSTQVLAANRQSAECSVSRAPFSLLFARRTIKEDCMFLATAAIQEQQFPSMPHFIVGLPPLVAVAPCEPSPAVRDTVPKPPLNGIPSADDGDNATVCVTRACCKKGVARATSDPEHLS